MSIYIFGQIFDRNKNNKLSEKIMIVNISNTKSSLLELRKIICNKKEGTWIVPEDTGVVPCVKILPPANLIVNK
jgi:hypothetical protein